MIPTSWYLALSVALLGFGLLGLVLRRNFITVLMSVELILNAANLNFVAFARQWGELSGQVFPVFIITIAAAEAAIGLGIIVHLARLRGTVALDSVRELRG